MNNTNETLKNFKVQVDNCFFTAKGDQEKLLLIINEIIGFVEADPLLSQQPNSLNIHYKTLLSNQRGNKDAVRLAFRDCKESCLEELEELIVNTD